jgi:hypothetical protein
MEKGKGKGRILALAAAVVAGLDLLFYFAMRDAWGGIATTVGIRGFYVYLLALFVVLAAVAVVMAFMKPRKIAAAILLGLSSVLFCALCYVLYVDIGSWVYILREFLYALLWTAGIAIIGLLLLARGRSPLAKGRAAALATLAIVVVAAVALTFDLGFLRFGEGPVVWAVGDEYQIVFTTTARSTASVEVGGLAYHDTYAGYDVSETRVHKVSVPMAALDAARAYTIKARAMILRGPYWAIQGRSIARSSAFRPLDPSDGIQYYSLSDTHEFVEPAVKAAAYPGDRLDFLVIAGDTSSFLDRPADLDRILAIAHGATRGERPAIYARGNHETKGRLSNLLHRYVGADGSRFYYTVRLGPVWAVVLDLGEDHADDWQEFYGAARFDAYRQEQTAFLDGLVAGAAREYAAPGITHRLAVCHIPVTFQYAGDPGAVRQKEWIERLDRMGLDLMLNGHRHQAMYISLDLPAGAPLVQCPAFSGKEGPGKVDGSRLEANFPAIIDSRRSEVQTNAVPEDLFGRRFFGLAVEEKGGRMELRYTNEKGQVLRTVGAWTGEDLGDVITVPCFKERGKD